MTINKQKKYVKVTDDEIIRDKDVTRKISRR